MKGTELKLFQKLGRTLISETVDVNTHEEYVFHDHMNSESQQSITGGTLLKDTVQLIQLVVL